MPSRRATRRGQGEAAAAAGAATAAGHTQTPPQPVPAPSPPPEWLAAIEAEEAEAAVLRGHAEAASAVVEAKITAAHDTRRVASLLLHADMAATELLRLAVAELLTGVEGRSALHPLPRVRLLLWDEQTGRLRAPCLVAECGGGLGDGGRGGVTLRDLGIAAPATLLLETCPTAGGDWASPPSPHDLYVRTRLWVGKPAAAAAAAAAPPPDKSRPAGKEKGARATGLSDGIRASGGGGGGAAGVVPPPPPALVDLTPPMPTSEEPSEPSEHPSAVASANTSDVESVEPSDSFTKRRGGGGGGGGGAEGRLPILHPTDGADGASSSRARGAKPFAKNVRWTSQLADLVEIRRRAVDDRSDSLSEMRRGGASGGRRISWDLSELVISPHGPDRWSEIGNGDDGDDGAPHHPLRDAAPPPPSSASSVSSRRSSGSVSSATSNASSAASEDDYADDEGLAASDDDESDDDESDDGGGGDDDDATADESDGDGGGADGEAHHERLVRLVGGGGADGGDGGNGGNGGGATLSLLRRALEAAFGVEAPLQRIVRTKGDASELIAAPPGVTDADAPLASYGLGGAGETLVLEAASGVSAPSRLFARREARRHRIEIFYNAPGRPDGALSITVDRRATVGSLKKRLASRLCVGRDALRLRRAFRGPHITSEMEAGWSLGEGGLNLCSGDAVHVEEGAPLHAGELLVRCFWAMVPEPGGDHPSTFHSDDDDHDDGGGAAGRGARAAAAICAGHTQAAAGGAAGHATRRRHWRQVRERRHRR